MKKSQHRHHDRRRRNALRWLPKMQALFRKAEFHRMLNEQSDRLAEAAGSVSFPRTTAEFEYVGYPIGTLTGEAQAHADRLLAASFRRVSEATDG